MEFKSSTKDSLIEEFSVLGYNDGDVCISIKFSSNSSEEVKQYLAQFDLIPGFFDLTHGYKSRGKDQLKVFFNILAKNNEIPVSHFEMIRDIVAKGTHR